MKMTPASINAAKVLLPTLSGSPVTYNAEKNVFLTQGYTSQDNNTYYRVFYVSDILVIRYDIGEGYKHTFLNGITLFYKNDNKTKIIAQKLWGGKDNKRIYNERHAKIESIIMFKEFLATQAKLKGELFEEHQLMEYSRAKIGETQQKKIC